jgi:hypothetical protein
MINQEEWDAFHTGVYMPDGIKSPLKVKDVDVKPSSMFCPNPAADFKRGNKWDKSHYKEIKDKKQWDEFKCTTMAMVDTYGYENVISTTYVPGTPEEVTLFNEQQKFMYNVWAMIPKTHMGNTLFVFMRTPEMLKLYGELI